MKLYYVPRTRATRPRWLLEELGLPYELVRLDVGVEENRQPAYLAIHPHGKVPALVDGDLNLIESAAICLHLADKHPEKGLAPTVGTPERARYYQWILYAMATLEPVVARIAAGARELPEGERGERARAAFADYVPVLERALGDHPYLLGEHFSAADVVLGSVLIWARFLGAFDSPRLGAYVQRLADRPAYRRARAD